MFDMFDIQLVDIYNLSTLCMPASVYTMMFYPTIGSTYFVKTRTYVALFCPHELSIIFLGVMYLELQLARLEMRLSFSSISQPRMHQF